jgi:hypothetical protein
MVDRISETSTRGNPAGTPEPKLFAFASNFQALFFQKPGEIQKDSREWGILLAFQNMETPSRHPLAPNYADSPRDPVPGVLFCWQTMMLRDRSRHGATVVRTDDFILQTPLHRDQACGDVNPG